MAWRIDEQVERGDVTFVERGRVTGRIWLAGVAEPIVLDLQGNPHRDLAGHRLTFQNPKPKPWPASMPRMATRQQGVVGDMTASLKVKVPECPMEEVGAYYEKGIPLPFHWGNGLYLEWFSQANGRVVIQSAAFELKLESEPAWTMTEAEAEAQAQANQNAMVEFMQRLSAAVADGSDMDGRLRADSEPPQSRAEADADADAARMDLLLDRVAARIDRDGADPRAFDTIFEEERAKLRRERGEPDPEPLTPEQAADQAAWIDEMNAAADEALTDMDRHGIPERKVHPLVTTCRDLGVSLHWDVKNNPWLPEGAPEEHPLYVIKHGVQSAGVKLGGALARSDDRWPPDPICAGDSLVRLKKARAHLHNALDGLDSADTEGLGTLPWRTRTRQEIDAILAAVQRLIADVRSVLESDSD